MTAEVKNEMTDEAFWSNAWSYSLPKRRLFPRMRNWIRQRCNRHPVRLYADLIGRTGCQTGDLLELGCAPGFVLERIHTARPDLRLHGIDFSESGLAAARERMEMLGARVSLSCEDIFEISRVAEFDIVLSTGLIEHFVDPLPMVKCHVRLCKPEGHVIITVPNFVSRVSKFFHERFDPESLAVHNLSIMHLDALKTVMQDAGLTDVQVGKSDPPRLHEADGSNRPFARVYRRFAKLWNTSVYLLPFPPLWRSNLWAIGQVPSHGSKVAEGRRIDSP
jgi:2-polyprenyl-3-methyl-5-hydroxy-6-metoxy-1,4-benzoquinol methylase